jgi:hypothetical protein
MSDSTVSLVYLLLLVVVLSVIGEALLSLPTA